MSRTLQQNNTAEAIGEDTDKNTEGRIPARRIETYA